MNSKNLSEEIIRFSNLAKATQNNCGSSEIETREIELRSQNSIANITNISM